MMFAKRWAIVWLLVAFLSVVGFVFAAGHSLEVSDRVQNDVPYVDGTAGY